MTMSSVRSRRLRPRVAPQDAAAGVAVWLRRTATPAAVRAWAAVAGAFIVTMVGFGAIYSYAAFAEEIAAAFGASKVSVSIVYALSGSSCFFVGAVAGPLADRLGARFLAALGMTLVGLGLATAAMARSLVDVYAGYGIMVGLGCGFAYVPALAAVQRSFDAHRGLASGLALSGIGIGTALVPPASEAFAAMGDWRSTFLACGVLAVIVGLGGAALLPTDCVKDSSELAAANSDALPTEDGQAFALACAGTLLVSLTAALPHAALVGAAQDLGIGRDAALALLGMIGIGAIIGRIALAAAADRVGRRKMFLLCCAGMSASMLVWATASNVSSLRLFAFGFGALQGGFVALLPAFVADTFGPRALGARLGALYTSRGAALLAGPPLLALGVASSYGRQAPLIIASLIGLIGVVSLAAVRPARMSRTSP